MFVAIELSNNTPHKVHLMLAAPAGSGQYSPGSMVGSRSKKMLKALHPLVLSHSSAQRNGSYEPNVLRPRYLSAETEASLFLKMSLYPMGVTASLAIPAITAEPVNAEAGSIVMP